MRELFCQYGPPCRSLRWCMIPGSMSQTGPEMVGCRKSWKRWWWFDWICSFQSHLAAKKCRYAYNQCVYFITESRINNNGIWGFFKAKKTSKLPTILFIFIVDLFHILPHLSMVLQSSYKKGTVDSLNFNLHSKKFRFEN